MKNLSKYITFNLLSVLGYIFFVFLIIVLFVLFPNAKLYDSTSGADMPSYMADLAFLFFGTSFIFVILEFLIIFLSFFEFLIYKIKKIEPVIKIPNKFDKIHLICFIIGLLLSFIPIVIVSWIFIKSDS